MHAPRTLASSLATPALVLAGVLLATGCAVTRTPAYSGLASAPQLQANTQEDAEQRPYVYRSAINWSDYKAVLVEPVSVYDGADNQFGDLPQADKRELALYMTTAFNQQLAMRFTLTRTAAPGTLRLKLTLTGATTNTAVVSTFTRFDLFGLPYNAVQSARGKEGIFMGSVSYSVEIFDAMSNRLVLAYVAKQHPNAMNVAATVGALSAARTGIDKGAEQLLRDMQ